MKDSLYDEITYTIYLPDSHKCLRYVSGDELRFPRLTRDEERKLKIRELQKQLEAQTRISELTRNELTRAELRSQMLREAQGRGRSPPRARGRSRRAVPRQYPASARNSPLRRKQPPPRATSVGAEEIPNTAGMPKEDRRASSLPPSNYTWPQFIADLTHAVYMKGDVANEDDMPTYDRRVLAPEQITNEMHNIIPQDEQLEEKHPEYDDRDNFDDYREVNADLKQGGERVADQLDVTGSVTSERRGHVERTNAINVYTDVKSTRDRASTGLINVYFSNGADGYHLQPN